MIDDKQQPDNPLDEMMGELAGQSAASGEQGGAFAPESLSEVAERITWDDAGGKEEQASMWPVADGRVPVPGDVQQLIEQMFPGKGDDMTPRLATGDPLRWGKVTADWAHGVNTVTVNPCGSDGANVDTSATVTVYCTLPVGNLPPHIELSEDDVVAYLAFRDVANDRPSGVLVSPSKLPPIPNVANEYGLIWASGEATVKWVELAEFECPPL